MNFKYFSLLLLIISGQASQANEPEFRVTYNDDYSTLTQVSSHNNSQIHIQEGSEVIGIIAACVFLKELVFGESQSKKESRLQKELEDRIEKERKAKLFATIDEWTYEEFLRHYRLRDPLFEETLKKDFSQDQAFCQIHLYRYSGFQDVLYRHPSYIDYVAQLQKKVKNDKKFFHQYGYKPGEFEAIVEEMVWNADFKKNYRKEQAEEKKAKEEKEARLKKDKQIKEQNQVLQKKQVTAIMQADGELKAYYQTYQAIDFQEVDGTETPQVQFAQKRYNALHDYMLGNDDWKEEKYPISTDVKALLNEHTINELAYNTLFGNHVQHILHQEFLTILEGSAEMRYHQHNIPQDCKDITTTLTLFAHAGQLHNHAGHIKKAYTFADFCWGMIDCVQKAYEFECELEYAVGRGLIKGGNNFASKMLDPIKTIEDMRTGLTSLAKLAFELNEDLKDKAYQHIKRKIVQRTRDIRDLTLGRTTLQKLVERDYNEFTYSCDQTVTQVHDAIQFVWGKLDKENILYATENGTAFITEMALSHATFSALGSLVSSGGASLSGIIESGGGAGNFLNLPFNSSTLQAAIAYEAIFVDSAQQAAQLVQVASVGIAQALDKASVIAPPLLMAADGGAGNGPSNPVSGVGNIPNPPMDIIQAVGHMPNSLLAHLENTFDGKLISNGQPVKFAYKHLWEAHAAKNGIDLSGFHHDYMGVYRKQGMIRNMRMNADGFYKAEVLFNGKWVEKSFFPEHWTHDQVMQSVFEAFNNPTRDIVRRGCRILEGELSSGIIIRNVIVNATGKGITVFPLL